MQPGKQSFNSPAAPIATQWPAILGLAPRGAVVPMRGDHLDADCGHLAIQFVTVISFVSDQALGPFLCETAVDGGRDESDFMRTRRLDVNGDWSAIAVCHCHELRTLTPLGLADGSAPFFALTKLPSMKPSDRSKLPCWRKCRVSDFSTFSNTPVRTHAAKRRWHVWYGGYRSGRSCQRAPVRKIHNTPFMTSRVSRCGRPRTPTRGWGNNGSISAHCSSVNSSRRGINPPITDLMGRILCPNVQSFTRHF